MSSNSIELILEIPAGGGSVEEFPGEDEIPRTGFLGQQFIQIGVVVTLASVQILRTWLLARAERLKMARVTWEEVEFEAYAPKEIERITQTLKRQLGEDEG
jgi:hypothetical protein